MTRSVFACVYWSVWTGEQVFYSLIEFMLLMRFSCVSALVLIVSQLHTVACILCRVVMYHSGMCLYSLLSALCLLTVPTMLCSILNSIIYHCVTDRKHIKNVSSKLWRRFVGFLSKIWKFGAWFGHVTAHSLPLLKVMRSEVKVMTQKQYPSQAK